MLGQISLANMASPVRPGTYSSAAFSSNQIDILKEKIIVTVDSNFKTASFIIEYYIHTDRDGKQIPFLFHAVDYKDDFKVWIDDQAVVISDVPSGFRDISNSLFSDFSGSIRDNNEVVIKWDDNTGIVYNFSDLKYFETSFKKGEHKIRVEYTAYAWTDIGNWVKEYSFRYSLSPAKHWKSFGTLEIILNSGNLHNQITTNIGQPQSGNLESISVWTFDKLPAEYFNINYIPQLSFFANVMLSIGTDGLTILFALIIILLHILFIINYRKNNPLKKYSPVLIIGGIIIPFMILCFNVYSYELIDNIIGEDAGNYHGYIFLIMFLYPLFMPIYFLLMWLIDKLSRRKLISLSKTNPIT